MKTYDLYMFASGQAILLGWHRFEAVDEAAAIELAGGLARHPPLELHCEGLLIKRWDGKPSIQATLPEGKI